MSTHAPSATDDLQITAKFTLSDSDRLAIAKWYDPAAAGLATASQCQQFIAEATSNALEAALTAESIAGGARNV
jgi:hypothetical protein